MLELYNDKLLDLFAKTQEEVSFQNVPELLNIENKLTYFYMFILQLFGTIMSNSVHCKIVKYYVLCYYSVFV